MLELYIANVYVRKTSSLHVNRRYYRSHELKTIDNQEFADGFYRLHRTKLFLVLKFHRPLLICI